MTHFKPMKAILALLFLCALPALSTSGEEKPFTATTGPEGVQRVEITGGSYYFKPDHIIVKVNVPVELVVKKARTLTPHNFVMHSPGAGMDFNVKLGAEPKSIRFTPVKTGKYEFYCDKKLLFFPSHKSQGMRGTLEVTE